jgi:hypothetical protein
MRACGIAGSLRQGSYKTRRFVRTLLERLVAWTDQLRAR